MELQQPEFQLHMLYAMSIKLLQILPDDPGYDSNCHAPLFINPGDGKAHIIFLAGSPVIIAGVGHSVHAVGQPDIDHAFMYIRNLAGILALDAAFFQIVMVGVLGHAFDVSPDAHILQAVTAHVQDAYKNLVAHGKALMGIPDPLPGQVAGHDGAFHPENFYPDNLLSHGDHTGLGDTALIYAVHACRIRIQIEDLPFPEHGFLPAGNHAAGFGINAFDNKINLRSQHIAEDLVLAQHQFRIFLAGRAAAHIDHHLF